MATKSISHEKEAFLTDVKEIRRRARQQIMEGAVTRRITDLASIELQTDSSKASKWVVLSLNVQTHSCLRFPPHCPS